MLGRLVQAVVVPAARRVRQHRTAEGVLLMLGRERPRRVGLQDDVADVVVVEELIRRARGASNDYMTRRPRRRSLGGSNGRNKEPQRDASSLSEISGSETKHALQAKASASLPARL